jgi:hypothetical protein
MSEGPKLKRGSTPRSWQIPSYTSNRCHLHQNSKVLLPPPTPQRTATATEYLKSCYFIFKFASPHLKVIIDLLYEEELLNLRIQAPVCSDTGGNDLLTPASSPRALSNSSFRLESISNSGATLPLRSFVRIHVPLENISHTPSLSLIHPPCSCQHNRYNGRHICRDTSSLAQIG